MHISALQQNLKTAVFILVQCLHAMNFVQQKLFPPSKGPFKVHFQFKQSLFLDTSGFTEKQNAFNLQNVFSISEQCRQFISSRLFFIVEAVLRYKTEQHRGNFPDYTLCKITTKLMREKEMDWLLLVLWFFVFITLSKKVLLLDR